MLRNGLTIDLAQCEAMECLRDEQAGRLIKALARYFREGTEETDEDIRALFVVFKVQVDEEKQRYEAICQRNRLNGTKHTKKEPKRTQWDPVGFNQETESETERDKEKVTPKEKEKEKEKGKELNKENHAEKKETTGQTELFEPEEAPEEKKKATTPRFQKPSVAEVEEYVRQKGYEQWVDAEAFWSYHENRDWKVGNHTMKSWHLAITTWMRNSRTKQPQRTQHGTSVGERAYNMLHFEYEGHPEMWEEEEKKFAELQKYF